MSNQSHSPVQSLVKLKVSEGFAQNISEETKEALKRIDENILQAHKIAHLVYCD